MLSSITGLVRHMLIRMRVPRAYQVFLLSGLLVAVGQNISAQSEGKAPSVSPQTSQAARPTQAQGDASVKPQAPPQPVIKFADVVKKVEEEGGTSVPNYIAEDVGIQTTQTDSSPVRARALSDTQRELYVIYDTGALLFLVKNGDMTFAYLANHAGVLQTAGYFYPGRFHSQDFKNVSKEKAAAGFAAEKEIWIKKISNPQYGDAVKPQEPVRKPDYAKSEAGAKTAATARASADVDEKDKLSQMTSKERIKYLDQQMRQAKQEARLKKKESAKEKKLASKTAQAAPANSNQQSNTDGDAAPPKKKISWF